MDAARADATICPAHSASLCLRPSRGVLSARITQRLGRHVWLQCQWHGLVADRQANGLPLTLFLANEIQNASTTVNNSQTESSRLSLLNHTALCIGNWNPFSGPDSTGSNTHKLHESRLGCCGAPGGARFPTTCRIAQLVAGFTPPIF